MPEERGCERYSKYIEKIAEALLLYVFSNPVMLKATFRADSCL